MDVKDIEWDGVYWLHLGHGRDSYRLVWTRKSIPGIHKISEISELTEELHSTEFTVW
jgi:hypothetical protein